MIDVLIGKLRRAVRDDQSKALATELFLYVDEAHGQTPGADNMSGGLKLGQNAELPLDLSRSMLDPWTTVLGGLRGQRNMAIVPAIDRMSSPAIPSIISLWSTRIIRSQPGPQPLSGRWSSVSLLLPRTFFGLLLRYGYDVDLG
jgi:hypothetical protein